MAISISKCVLCRVTNSYYGYRFTATSTEKEKNKIWEDPRLLLMKKKYLRRKTVLDIGCNAGYLTISLAQQFRPKMIVGIDIDGILISKAKHVLNARAKELCQNNKQIKALSPDTNDFSDDSSSDDQTVVDLMSFSNYRYKDNYSIETINLPEEMSDSFFRQFPFNVYFKKEDFINDIHYGDKYDTITCFSVTKWIHLNWGDIGLLYFLLKAYSLLKENGILIIEYQSWSSYSKKRTYCPEIEKVYPTIHIHPEHIPIILERIGMHCISNRKPIKDKTIPENISKGFNRNIAVFKRTGDDIPIDFRKVTINNLEKNYDINKLIEGLECEEVV